MLHSRAEIEIKTHRKVIFELLTRPTARMLWHPDLERAVLMKGEAGRAGASTALVFRSGEGQRRTLETVLSADARSSLHVVQTTGKDELHMHYGFVSVRPGYLKISLTAEFKPGSALDAMRGLFDKQFKLLAQDQLDTLNTYVTQRNLKRKVKRAKRKAAEPSS